MSNRASIISVPDFFLENQVSFFIYQKYRHSDGVSYILFRYCNGEMKRSTLIILFLSLAMPIYRASGDYYVLEVDSCRVGPGEKQKVYADRIIAPPNNNIEVFFLLRKNDSVTVEPRRIGGKLNSGPAITSESNSLTLKSFNNGRNLLEPFAINPEGDSVDGTDVLISIDEKKMYVHESAEKKIREKKSLDSLNYMKSRFLKDHLLEEYGMIVGIIAAAILLIAVITQILKIKRRRARERFKRQHLGDEKEEIENKQVDNSNGGTGMDMAELRKLSKEELLEYIESMHQEKQQMNKQLKEFEKKSNQLKGENAVLAANVTKLSEKKQELENLQAQKDDLFTLLLHDIKNPIAIIKSLVELLTSYDINAMDQSDIIKEIAKSTNRVVSLSQEIARVLILDKTEIVIEETVANVNDIAKDVYSRNKVNADRKNQNIKIKIDDSISPIPIDVMKVDEMIDNLVSNAIKFTQKKGNILISTYMREDHINIDVKDDGLGISDEDMAKMFQKGRRLSNVPTAGENSTGFGLWIVKKLAQAHGGNVYVKSRVGIGSTFSISLPLNYKEAKQSNENS